VKKPLRFRLAPATLPALLPLALILVAFVAPPSSTAQAIVEDGSVQSGRKVVTRVQPEYPILLKVARIGGIVKVNAVVLPDGTVTKVTALGGNPVLAEKTIQAVMQWKFAPASVQTNEIVWFSFHAH